MRRILTRLTFVIIFLFFAGLAYFLYQFFHRTDGQYFDSAGTKLYYFEKGKTDAPPVILIHGFASQADRGWVLTGTVNALKDNYHLVLFDGRGRGKSDKPHDTESYGLEMVHDVARLMDHLGIKKAHIAGYSLGGFISLKFAELYPDRCISIAVMGAGWEDGANSKAMQALEKAAGLLRAGKSIGPLGAMIDEDRPEPTRLHKFMTRLSTGYLNDPNALAAVAESAPELAVSKEVVQNLKMPVLSIVGEKDVFYPAAKRLFELAPKCSQTIIPDAGHIKAATSPIRSEALKAFLDGV